MIENQLNERNIVIKKMVYMHAYNKKKYINCGKFQHLKFTGLIVIN